MVDVWKETVLVEQNKVGGKIGNKRLVTLPYVSIPPKARVSLNHRGSGSQGKRGKGEKVCKAACSLEIWLVM